MYVLYDILFINQLHTHIFTLNNDSSMSLLHVVGVFEKNKNCFHNGSEETSKMHIAFQNVSHYHPDQNSRLV